MNDDDETMRVVLFLFLLQISFEITRRIFVSTLSMVFRLPNKTRLTCWGVLGPVSVSEDGIES
jgi:hypothetical protein